MSKSLFWRVCLFMPVLYLALTMVSCNTTKKIKYFQDIPDSGQLKTISKVEYTEPVIQIDDILSIVIQTIDPLSTSMINVGNLPVSSTVPSGTLPGLASQASAGYLVDKDGFVELPVLGKIKVVGYSTTQARDIIKQSALKFFKDATVTIRYSNFKVSVTGEVSRPGQYIMPNEKVSIMDALAMAGDLTVFGKRENVLLIRENADGTKTPYRINLKKSDVMYAPYYYLRQNDIIYVEPRKAKSDATDAAQTKYVGIIGAVLSVIIVLATRVK